MKNARLRFGWLSYVKSTEKTTTSINLRLHRRRSYHSQLQIPNLGGWWIEEHKFRSRLGWTADTSRQKIRVKFTMLLS